MAPLPRGFALKESEAPQYDLSIRLCTDGAVCTIAPNGRLTGIKSSGTGTDFSAQGAKVDANGEKASTQGADVPAGGEKISAKGDKDSAKGDKDSAKGTQVSTKGAEVAAIGEKGSSQGVQAEEETVFIPLKPYLQRDWIRAGEEYPFLLYPFDRVELIFRPRGFMLMPWEEDLAALQSWWELVAPPDYAPQEGFLQGYPLQAGQPNLCSVWHNEQRSFLFRFFGGLHAEPTPLRLIKQALNRSMHTSQKIFCAELFSDGLDIVLCHKGGVLFANHFSWPGSASQEQQAEQVLYFMALVRNAREGSASSEPGEYSFVLSDGECGHSRYNRTVVELVADKLPNVSFISYK